jgi:hypothetical protein
MRKLTPQQETVGAYIWESRIRRHKGAKANTFVNQSTAYGTPDNWHNTVTDLRNEAQTRMSRENPIRLLGRKDHPEEIGGNFESSKIQVFLDSWEPVRFWNPDVGSQPDRTVIPSPSLDLDVVHNLASKKLVGTDPENLTQLKAYIQGVCPPRYSDTTLDIWGTQVIASVAPTNPVADLSTTLAELASERKFFSLPSEKSTLSGDYLNLQFGVAPTVGFAQDFRKAVANRDAIIAQYERDSGKRIRRKYGPPPVITTTKVVESQPLCALGLNTLSTTLVSYGTLTKITKTTEWKSFSGAFTYYLPKREEAGGDLARLDKLYGVNPLNNFKGLAWELTPYSWLVDYFSSAGAYQKNIDSFRDGSLVMPYAYVMFSKEIDVSYTWTGPVSFGTGASGRVIRTYGGRVVKTIHQRRRATPYGFGLSSSSLTAKQWSILAALGISRVF